jgi:hypothetical protein
VSDEPVESASGDAEQVRCDACGRTGTDDRQFVSTLHDGEHVTLCGVCDDESEV